MPDFTVITTLALLVALLAPSAPLVAQGQAPAAGAAIEPETGQQEPPADNALFAEAVEVKVVNLEVYVTDKKGRWVGDLERDDFTVYEDGQPVEISNFYVVEPGSGAAAASEVPRPAPGVAAEPGPQPLQLVLIFDNQHLRPDGRGRLIADLRQFLADSLGPGDRVMMVSHDNGSLNLALPFTSNREEIEAALDTIERMPASGIQGDSDRRSTLDSISQIYRLYLDSPIGVPCEDGFEQMQAQARVFAGARQRDVANTVRALAYLTSAIGGLPGPKAVLYAGGGLPQFAGLEMFHHLLDLCPERQREFSQEQFRYDTTSMLTQLTEHANANRVTFYTLETAGLRTNSRATVDAEGPLGVLGGSGRSTTPSNQNDRIRVGNLQSSLYALAHETGGQAVFNANRFAHDLGKIARDFSHFYAIGYTPPHGGDGVSHRLRVEVDNRRYQVRYRRAYRDKPLDDQLAERALATLLFGLEVNPLAARVAVAGEQRLDDGRYLVRVRVTVPSERLLLLPDQELERGQLRLVITARDGENRTLPIKQKQVPVEIARGATGSAAYEVGIELPAGHHDVVVGVRDDVAAVASFLRHPIEVGASAPAAGDPVAPATEVSESGSS